MATAQRNFSSKTAMNNCLRILPLLAIFSVSAHAQPKPDVPSMRIKTQIDPKAVDLLDKVAAHYKSVKTMKLVAQGSTRWEGETMPNRLTLFFARPNKIRVQGESDDTKGVFVADGKTIFSWSDLAGSFTLPQNDRYTQPWRELMTTTDFLIGSYLSKWLFGGHWLRPLQTDQIVTDADSFEARVLPTKIVNGAPAQGVQLSATKAAQGKTPKYTSEQTMWFRADGRLVRAELVNYIGTKIKRGAVDVTGELDNSILPASTWLLKK